MTYTPTVWQNRVTTLGPTNLNKLEQGLAAETQLRFNLAFSVMDPQFAGGAKGDWDGNSGHDDTAAWQATFNAAIAAASYGAAVKVVIPTPLKSYKLTDTILIQAAGGGSAVNLNVESHGNFAAIRWVGGNNKAIFKSYGWKASIIQGIQVRLENPAGSDGVILFDVDHDATRSSTGVLTFNNCHLGSLPSTGANTNCIGWRIGHGPGAEFSFISFNQCGAGFDWTKDVNCSGWVLEENNGLIVSWDQCGGTGCVETWTTRQTAGAAMPAGSGAWLLKNCGGSYNQKEIFYGGAKLRILGGRWELGRMFIDIPFGTTGCTVTMDEVEIADFTPNLAGGERLFSLNRGSTIMDNCSLGHSTADYGSSTIQLNNGSKPVYLHIRGGIYRCVDPFIFEVNPALTRVTIENAYKVDGAGVITGLFNDRRHSPRIWRKAGAPVDGDFSSPQDGLQALDTSNHRLYIRDGGVWKYAALT